MFCMHCRNQMNPQERYCSRCGKESSLVVPAVYPPTMRNWDNHVKVLACIYMGSALFMLLPGMFFMLVPGMMMGMAHSPFHFAGPLFFTIALTFLSIPAAVLIAGWGMLGYRDWARALALILAALMLVGFPVGTAIGIYAFWVLLSQDGSRSYKQRSALEKNELREAPGAG